VILPSRTAPRANAAVALRPRQQVGVAGTLWDVRAQEWAMLLRQLGRRIGRQCRAAPAREAYHSTALGPVRRLNPLAVIPSPDPVAVPPVAPDVARRPAMRFPFRCGGQTRFCSIFARTAVLELGAALRERPRGVGQRQAQRRPARHGGRSADLLTAPHGSVSSVRYRVVALNLCSVVLFTAAGRWADWFIDRQAASRHCRSSLAIFAAAAQFVTFRNQHTRSCWPTAQTATRRRADRGLHELAPKTKGRSPGASEREPRRPWTPPNTPRPGRMITILSPGPGPPEPPIPTRGTRPPRPGDPPLPWTKTLA